MLSIKHVICFAKIKNKKLSSTSDFFDLINQISVRKKVGKLAEKQNRLQEVKIRKQ